MKRFFLVTILVCMVTFIQSQVITWSVKPGMYSKIEPYWDDMYLAFKNNNVGVIRGDGMVIVAPEASRITGFYGGLSLVLKADGGQERIMGILSTDGSYTKVDGTYYTIPRQEFFSEGMLTIMNSRGQAGYMNGNGVVTKTFDDSFACPFSEGYATVGEGQDFKIIDKRFNILQIPLPSVSPLYGGANVYKGIAIVWDGNGNFYEFNPKSGTCYAFRDKKVKNDIKSFDFQYDYLGGISSLTKRPELVSYEASQRLPETIKVREQGGKYGYADNEKTLLPFQFEQAESFRGNYAIVKTHNGVALLSQQKSEEGFNAVASNSTIKYKKNNSKDIQHMFGIAIPSQWKDRNMNIIIKDDNGILKNVINKDGNYVFGADGNDSEKNFTVEIESDGLKIWTGPLTYKYEIKKEDPIPTTPSSNERVKEFTVKLKINNTKADRNNHCNVTATIYNPNPEDISAMVTFSGSNLLEKVSKRIVVPARGTKDVSTYFTVEKVQLGHGQKVTVTTSAGGRDTLDGLQLIPFD